MLAQSYLLRKLRRCIFFFFFLNRLSVDLSCQPGVCVSIVLICSTAEKRRKAASRSRFGSNPGHSHGTQKLKANQERTRNNNNKIKKAHENLVSNFLTPLLESDYHPPIDRGKRSNAPC